MQVVKLMQKGMSSMTYVDLVFVAKVIPAWLEYAYQTAGKS
jgi:hypothetical protein